MENDTLKQPPDVEVETYRVRERRHFSAHHMFLQTAKSAMERAEKDQYERQNSLLTVMVMCSLFVEAMCNAVGSRIVNGWADYDRLSPWGKARLICAQLGAEFDPGKEPLQSLRWLLKFRNDFAHAKPEVVETDRVLTADEVDDMHRGRTSWTPISKLEGQLSVEVAARAVRTAEKFKQLLVESLDFNSSQGIDGDGWSGSITPVVPSGREVPVIVIPADAPEG
jgi:hypothetical protein